MLVLHPKLKGAVLPANFTICLRAAIPVGSLSLEKLKATKNNLRTAAAASSAPDQEQTLMPTPHYNASILEVGSLPAKESCHLHHNMVLLDPA